MFATVIAITKDLPDVEGDKANNITTFATRMGVKNVSLMGESGSCVDGQTRVQHDGWLLALKTAGLCLCLRSYSTQGVFVSLISTIMVIS